MNNLSTTVKMLRKQYNLTQEELSLKSGVGLRFVRDLEQGKETLRLDKVNQLLDFFNYEMVATQKTVNNETAHIFYKDQLAGILTENDAGYEFCYLPEYLSLETAKSVSLTLPLQGEAYTSPVLFPFFDGLIPEGWLLDVALRNTDISILDRMSLLLICCKDCIGAVSVIPLEEKEGNHV